MPRVEEIARYIEELAPLSLAESWDNVGPLVNCGGDITSVLVSLDITDEVVSEAEQQGCQLIVAHHPVIFRPLAHIAQGDVVFRMVKKSISAVCAHTNLDAAPGGVNDILAAIFGIQEPQPFSEGIGRCGKLRSPVTAGQIADICATRFAAHVRLVDTGRPVTKLAVYSGSGSGLLEEALAADVDCVLTGEADHHDAIDFRHAGVNLVVAGHFSTEFPIVPVLADRLSARFPALRVLVSRRNKDPFTYLP